MSARDRAGAVALGAGGALLACVGVAAAVDPSTRREVEEALVTVAAAPAVAALYPFRRWGVRRTPPEALASLIRSHFTDDDSPALRFWTFALTRSTGLVWLREVPRGGRKWRMGSTADFRAPIQVRVRDLAEDEEQG